MHTISPITATDRNLRHGGDPAIPAMPRLSITAAALPAHRALCVLEVAPRWWLITLGVGATARQLVHGVLDRADVLAECWPLLVLACEGRDPLDLVQRQRIYQIYPPYRAMPQGTIALMEATGGLIPWPQESPP